MIYIYIVSPRTTVELHLGLWWFLSGDRVGVIQLCPELDILLNSNAILLNSIKMLLTSSSC